MQCLRASIFLEHWRKVNSCLGIFESMKSLSATFILVDKKYLNVSLFPSNSFRCTNNNREEWVKSIANHHAFNASSFFYVCFRHFKENEYSRTNGNELKLNADACPTVFESRTKQTSNTAVASGIDHFDACNDDAQEAINSVEENTSESQNDQLKAELFKLKVAHEIEVQKYKGRIQTLENHCEDKRKTLQQIRNELGREKLKNKRLEALNKELRGNHIASTSVENVNLPLNLSFHFNIS